MATQSRLTPPLAPCSEEDIASFNVLALALRALPELSRENEKILNAEQLARLTEGIRIFQHAHLGRVRTRPILFRCLLALSTRYRFRYFTRHCFAHSFCVPCQFPNPPPPAVPQLALLQTFRTARNIDLLIFSMMFIY